ncbi:MAG TPA: transcription elongation factor GreAB [Deltaproteobacteria bacterium]|nr:transcription elongation factor GreAB [Deltaproteobacteria bacterium]
MEELKRVYSERIASAARAESDAGQAAEAVRAEVRRREDAKDAALQGRLESGHRRRRKRAVAEMERLLAFAEGGVRRFEPSGRVGLGVLVDVRIEDEAGEDERTLFFLPVGAGVELHGPGGDGFVVVVTPGSPVGRALMGSQVGDCFEIVVEGQDREWRVVDLM